MKVIKRSNKTGYPQDSIKYFDLKRFEKECDDFVLLEGAFEQAHQWEQFDLSEAELKRIRKKKIVRLEFEEPNKFFLGDKTDKYDTQFYKIFNICPYSAKWLNERQGNDKRTPIFYPVNEKYVPKKTKKLYDVVYIGHIVSKRLMKDLDTISKFNYKFVSNDNHPLVTDRAVSYEGKFDVLAQTKIALVHNVLFPKPYHILNVWREKDWQKNEAFRLIPPWYKFWKVFDDEKIYVPQVKTRLFESALSRCVILCKKDPFNIIEKFFKPDEFVYYEEGELEKKIKHILKNYDTYQQVAERAYKRAINNYTTRKLADHYLKKVKV